MRVGRFSATGRHACNALPVASAFQPAAGAYARPVVEYAGRKDVKLVSVKVGGKALSEGDYKLAPDSLTITSPPSGTFQVSLICRCPIARL